MYLFIYFLIYLWLCWVFVSVRGLSLVAASGGHSSSWCVGLSLSWPLLLRSTGSRRAGSVVVAHGPSCSAACRIFPDQGSNPRPLHWQADSQPLRHQGSPNMVLLVIVKSRWDYGYFTISSFHLSIFSNFSLMSSGAFEKESNEKNCILTKTGAWLWLLKFNHAQEFCKEDTLSIAQWWDGERAGCHTLGSGLRKPPPPWLWPVCAT